MGDKPSHEADFLWARSSKQHIARPWRWLKMKSTEPRKWHNDEISKTTVASLKLCVKWQQSPTCFHLVCIRTATMLFLNIWGHGVKILYSAGWSLDRSSARGPFALQAGTWRPSASTAWRWGLPFIYREQTVTPLLSPDRGWHCALFQQRKHLLKKYGEQICSLFGSMRFKNKVSHRKYWWW